MENVIEIEHLNKSYGDVKAVQDLSFMVKRGELFAFLGVNGAGKSTTISMICGQLERDSGSVTVCGGDIERDFDAISRKIGVVFQASALDAQLSARDNLKSRAALYGITGSAFGRRFEELSEMLDFGEFADRPLNKLSGGQKRRIDIARAIVHDPEILILDEPTTGLDPQTRHLLWDADYVVILDAGKIAAEGTPLDLKNRFVGDYVTLYGCDEGDVLPLGLPYTKIRDAVKVTVPSTEAVTELILSHPALFKDYEVIKGGMDDVFLAVTGKDLPGGASK